MTKPGDKELGMFRGISRRDFINGVAVATAGAAFPELTLSATTASAVDYPPLRSGLRGSHPGSFEVAHALTWTDQRDWGPVSDPGDGVYDLVVVGAGISGLAAAHFFRQKNPGARVLILDNHDDFGGHAKRNEFELGGKTIIGYGGSQSLEDPGWYSEASKTLLRDIGVDTQRFYRAYDQDFYRRHGLAGATYFDGRVYGEDQLVPYSLIMASHFLTMENGRIPVREAVGQMPIGANAKRELTRLMETREDVLTGIPANEQWRYLAGISYREFLEKHGGITDPEIFHLLSKLTADTCASIEISSAAGAVGYVGTPGYHATSLADDDESEPYIFHFPDGNAGVTRMLVKKLVPHVAPGTTMDEILMARFDYSQLDRDDAEVRLRLNSTAVEIAHRGEPETARRVDVTYVRGGKAQRVSGKACIYAGYGAMLPHICGELPEAQKQGLALQIKAPIMYTTVLLNNWRAFKKLGVGYISAPNTYYAVTMMDFPVSMGGYNFARTPDDPILVHMERFPTGDDPLASRRQQRLNGRREMYATSFETIERETRRQLAGALGGDGFDPAKDIEAITANRWGHGYACGVRRTEDKPDEQGRYFHEVGRQRHGLMTIANSDAGASASINAAISQAWRAVEEI